MFYSTGDACSLRLTCAIKFYLLTYLLKAFPAITDIVLYFV